MKVHLAKVFGMVFLLASVSARSEGNVEAVLGPGFGIQKISESWKSGTRSQYSLDFARISAGVSLNAIYGKGLGYTDYGAVLRFFGNKSIIPDSEKLTVWYGMGFGARYASNVSASITGLSSSTNFGRVFISPFSRIMYDINGWIAPFFELSYDFGIYGFGDSPAGLDVTKSSIVGVIGVAFEIER